MSDLQKLTEAIEKGDRNEAKRLTQELLNGGLAPLEIVEKGLVPGMATVGDSHGDIALTPKGEIYVSVQGGEHPGIQVYSAQGKYLRNIPGAPTDLHGFIIARAPDRKFCIYGVSRLAQQIVQMTLDETVTEADLQDILDVLASATKTTPVTIDPPGPSPRSACPFWQSSHREGSESTLPDCI